MDYVTTVETLKARILALIPDHPESNHCWLKPWLGLVFGLEWD